MSIELWFIRHGESKNNEILKRAGGLGAIAYPVEFTQDPCLTKRGALGAAENGQKLVDCNIQFDLCLTSNMVRTIETAYFMLIQSGLCEEMYVVPHMSEIPQWAGPIPIYENIPLARKRQVEKLGKLHGAGILESTNWDLVGGVEGRNRDCSPPSAPKFFDFIFHHPLVQAKLASAASGGKLRIAMVTHSNLLKQVLGSRPANADIWIATLDKPQQQAGDDAAVAEQEQMAVALSEAQPWFRQQIAMQRQVLARRIARVASRTERKLFKYETKIYKLKHGLAAAAAATDAAAAEPPSSPPTAVSRKESRLNQTLERKTRKYERKLRRLQAAMAERATNQSDRDFLAAQQQKEQEQEQQVANNKEEEEEDGLAVGGEDGQESVRAVADGDAEEEEGEEDFYSSDDSE